MGVPQKTGCDHFYVTHTSGDPVPVYVRSCQQCGEPDWQNLADQVAELLGSDKATADRAARRAATIVTVGFAGVIAATLLALACGFVYKFLSWAVG